eukprot:CAMPEP_0180734144 /NCGR_PEP_ID=MMETSP1038_2-20121128/22552_1 /TAXON_ID=632150 /ORGANISM="Azadinium spinosum, Strain 3D9" /LENGTH=431 /DNA_ID=CAMNT_0022767063 /DNA_START=9 /DNA_END=1301 /DNA_ORIENTATION=+
MTLAAKKANFMRMKKLQEAKNAASMAAKKSEEERALTATSKNSQECPPLLSKTVHGEMVNQEELNAVLQTRRAHLEMARKQMEVAETKEAFLEAKKQEEAKVLFGFTSLNEAVRKEPTETAPLLANPFAEARKAEKERAKKLNEEDDEEAWLDAQLEARKAEEERSKKEKEEKEAKEAAAKAAKKAEEEKVKRENAAKEAAALVAKRGKEGRTLEATTKNSPVHPPLLAKTIDGERAKKEKELGAALQARRAQLDMAMTQRDEAAAKEGFSEAKKQEEERRVLFGFASLHQAARKESTENPFLEARKTEEERAEELNEEDDEEAWLDVQLEARKTEEERSRKEKEEKEAKEAAAKAEKKAEEEKAKREKAAMEAAALAAKKAEEERARKESEEREAAALAAKKAEEERAKKEAKEAAALVEKKAEEERARK